MCLKIEGQNKVFHALKCKGTLTSLSTIFSLSVGEYRFLGSYCCHPNVGLGITLLSFIIKFLCDG